MCSVLHGNLFAFLLLSLTRSKKQIPGLKYLSATHGSVLQPRLVCHENVDSVHCSSLLSPHDQHFHGCLGERYRSNLAILLDLRCIQGTRHTHIALRVCHSHITRPAMVKIRISSGRPLH
ncbi:hypothetical protein BDW67DRAFT_26224 [Aspergillus spinulosporus]